MRNSTIWLIYIGILLLLTALTIGAYRNQKNLSEETAWIRHSNRVLAQLGTLLSVIKDAETGHRGYQLTQDTTFLEPYHQSVSFLDRDIRTLDSLLMDQQEQRIRKDSLKELILKQYAIINSILVNEDENRYRMSRYEMNLLILGKENMKKIRELVAVMRREEEQTLAKRLVDAQGKERIAPIALLVYALLALGGVSVLFMFLASELSKRRKTEAELLERAEDLKRSNEELEQFAYVASHDLQEPLRKIRAFGDRVATTYRDQLGENGRDYIDRMQTAALRMQALIDDLLSFARLSRVERQEEVNLNDVLTEVKEDMETLVERAAATITATGLPTISGDRGQMKRLFQNLISNAIKFRHQDRSPVVALDSLKVMKDDIQPLNGHPSLQDYYRITIKDNGIGFDDKYAEKIFVIFQRLHSRSSYEGTGIGLAICRKIATNHSGFIVARAVDGEGAQFMIYLPAENKFSA
jgi:signal transduction histidine kinase